MDVLAAELPPIGIGGGIGSQATESEFGGADAPLGRAGVGALSECEWGRDGNQKKQKVQNDPIRFCRRGHKTVPTAESSCRDNYAATRPLPELFSILVAVLTSARCENACGKLLIWRRRVESYSSERSPRWLRNVSRRSNNASASAARPAKA